MWSRTWILAPLIGAAVVFGIAVWIAAGLDFLAADVEVTRFELRELLPGIEHPDPGPSKAPSADDKPSPPLAGGLAEITRELRVRVAWGLTALTLILTLIVSLTLPWFLARRALAPLGRRRRPVMAAAVTVAAAVALAVGLGERVVLPHVLQTLVEELPAAVKAIRELLKGLSAAAMFTVFFAIGATLTPQEHERTAEHLGAQLRRLRILLFVSAGLLAAGVLEIGALLRWPSVRVPPSAAEPLGQLADAVTMAAGTLFTLLLLVTYGIASAVLAQRLDELARGAAADPEERLRWLKERGLDSTAGDHLLRILAVLAPLAAGGPLSGILDALAR